MGIIVDLILIILLAAFIYMGYRKGLTGCLLKLVSFFLAIVIAVVLHKPVAQIVKKNTNIDEGLKESIVQIFDKNEDKSNTEEKAEGLQASIVETINKEIASATQEAKNSIIESSATRIADSIINIGVGIVLFLASKSILVVLKFIIKGITNLPIIKQIDKTGGILYGLIEGLVIIYIVFAIISIVTMAWTNNAVYKAINNSALGSMMYNNNLIINFIFK